MIVRAGDDRKVKRVSKLDYVRLLTLNHSNAFGRRIVQLHCIQTRKPSPLVLRQFCNVARNREYEEWRRSSGGKRGIRLRIVPVAFWINREGRIDADCDYVFVLVTRL